MALIGSSSMSTPQLGLTPAYINQLIKAAINAQRAPIRTLTAQKDQLNVKMDVYSDLKSKLLTLEETIEGLMSGGDTVFDDVEAVSSDIDLLTATATSSAATSTYNVSITSLAESHTVCSDKQTSSSDALGLSGTFQLNGVSIEVQATDSLTDIMEAINSAEYEDGMGVIATIVDNHLVIESASTGTSHQLVASDTVGTVLTDLGVLDGGSFKTTLQEAEDAVFTVNGIQITRESNTGLDDVINGVTLNLIGETGDALTLEITTNYTSIEDKVNELVTSLNDALEYLSEHTKITADQENNVYTRGTLSGQTIFSRLRLDLVIAVRTQVTGGSEGDPEFLSDLGINIGNDLKLSFDEDMLGSALTSNLDGVIQLFDGVMEKLSSVLEPFTINTSSSNIIDIYMDSVDTRMDNIDNRIERIERVIQVREETLIRQYSALYLQSAQLLQQPYSILGISFSTIA